MGFYLVPNNTSAIESVVAALKERPRGAELLVSGDFNVTFECTRGTWHELRDRKCIVQPCPPITTMEITLFDYYLKIDYFY